MSVGARLKEERQRLGLSQPVFANMAGATKGAQAKWEKDDASPNAKALVAWVEAGVDAMYVLTGKRTAERPDNPVTQIEDQLTAIRRTLLDPDYDTGTEAERQSRARVGMHTNSLDAILRYDAQFLTPELRDEVESLKAIVADPAKIAAFRAADHVQRRAKRREKRSDLASWYEGSSFQPSEAVMSLLTTLAMDYAVPDRLLADLVIEIGEEIDRSEKAQAQLRPDR